MLLLIILLPQVRNTIKKLPSLRPYFFFFSLVALWCFPLQISLWHQQEFLYGLCKTYWKQTIKYFAFAKRGRGKQKLNAIFCTSLIHGAKFYPLCKTQLVYPSDIDANPALWDGRSCLGLEITLYKCMQRESLPLWLPAPNGNGMNSQTFHRRCKLCFHKPTSRNNSMLF